MAVSNKKLSGRPKKYTQISYFGLKMQTEDKLYLQLLAKMENKPASTVLVELIHKACKEKNIKLDEPKRMSAKEFLRLPVEKQEEILKQQANDMAKSYEIIEDNQELLNY